MEKGNGLLQTDLCYRKDVRMFCDFGQLDCKDLFLRSASGVLQIQLSYNSRWEITPTIFAPVVGNRSFVSAPFCILLLYLHVRFRSSRFTFMHYTCILATLSSREARESSELCTYPLLSCDTFRSAYLCSAYSWLPFCFYNWRWKFCRRWKHSADTNSKN